MQLDHDLLANGPVMKRSCTDVICCILFLAFFLGMIGAAIYGYMFGNPKQLLTSWDYDGNNN